MRRILTFLGLSLLILIMMAATLLSLFRFTPKYPILELEKGWTVIYHNEQFVNTNLERMSKQLGTTFSNGDTITLNYEKQLQYPVVPFPYIVFKSQYCGYQVYIDGNIIAEKDTNESFQNDFVGISYNAVSLPQNIDGSKLSIKLFICENNARVDMMHPIIGDYDDIYRYITHGALYPSFTGTFMIIFGTVFLIISLIFYLRTDGVAPQVLTSLLSISIGAWMITAFNCFDFVLDPAIATTIEYISMYSLLPLLYFLIASLHRRADNSVVYFLAITSTLFGISFVVLHVLNIVHINQFQMPYFFMAAIGLFILGMYCYNDFKIWTRISSTFILMIGITVLALSLTFYAVVAISKSVIDYRQSRLLYLLVPSGSLFFVTSQLLNHFIFMTRSFAQRKEYLSLSKIAYVDNLTGVSNRASFDSKMAEMENTDDDFCILSLDLNGLKEVNDNAGHPAGDRLLKSFAKTLLDVFSSKGDCFRVGGDEFIVIFKQIEATTLDSLLTELDSRLKKLDEEDTEINHSVSHGYCFRSETQEKDTHSVLMLADARMYEYKRNFYSYMMSR
ncbi:MAG: GGDEF domain-containing protein [Butyrivibrio sp.]|nr:GGDEF domain-containing protein [Butyrivibrio sp.]